VINEGRVPVKQPTVDPNAQFQKPKGKDLHEGGFDSSAPNASFRTDIGSKRDPGRVALQGLVCGDLTPGQSSHAALTMMQLGSFQCLGRQHRWCPTGSSIQRRTIRCPQAGRGINDAG
jgi:hypothetical protein